MYRKILVSLDGSQFSECSLEHAKNIAMGCQGADIFLLTVMEPVLPRSFWAASLEQSMEIGREMEKSRQRAREEAEKYLSQTADNLKQAGLSVQTVAIEGAENNKSVADVILDYAQDNNMDMIIISTHGRSGISRWAMGSVAEKVVRKATIPVLTIVPKGCRDAEQA
jgi:nucleotide-binding universal stress UspA family protein